MKEIVDNISWKSGYCIKCKIHSLISAALVCILLGGLWGYRCGTQHMSLEKNELEYGISGQDLHVHSVVWKDYPAWREVSFTMEGSVSFITEQNGNVALDGLTDPDAMEEVRREHNVFANGKDLIYYDDVTYVINEGTVNAAMPTICNRNVILDAVCDSFRVVFREKDREHIAGNILLPDETYQAWTAKQAGYADRNIDAYLSAFTLSGIYDAVRPLREKTQIEGVVLRKEEGNFLNCTISNNSSETWRYEAGLPHIELWYKGVWVELVSPFADNLMTAMIEPDQDRGFDVPEEVVMQYPALIDGIYRLVIYGENEKYAASDPFLVDGDIVTAYSSPESDE